jgi:hypothetical protein
MIDTYYSIGRPRLKPSIPYLPSLALHPSPSPSPSPNPPSLGLRQFRERLQNHFRATQRSGRAGTSDSRHECKPASGTLTQEQKSKSQQFENNIAKPYVQCTIALQLLLAARAGTSNSRHGCKSTVTMKKGSSRGHAIKDSP